MPVKKAEATVYNYNEKTLYRILFIISFVHLLNDTIQSLVPAMFPILKESMGLTFTQLGMIAFALNFTSSLIQPVVGFYTDKKPSPYALPIGLCFTFFGVLGIAYFTNFWLVVVAVAFIGLGSATFHPEGSRVAYMAAGNRRGYAQSIYQVGGNTGQALAPIITALVLVPLGQFGAIWFTILAVIAVGLLIYIARWYSSEIQVQQKSTRTDTQKKTISASARKKVMIGIGLLVFIVFARHAFQSGIINFYAFYTMEEYGKTIKEAQIYLFIFLGTSALGTFAGGPIADRYGKQTVIMLSMLCSVPLTIALPYVNSIMAYLLVAIIGFVLTSSFSVSVVYAQELVPGKIGMMSGLVVGLGFGMGAISSIGFGLLADVIGLINTIIVITLIPILGVIAYFLPTDKWISKNI